MAAIPVGLEAAVALGAFLLFVFLIGLNYGYKATIGLLVTILAGALDSIAGNLGPFGFLFSSPAGWLHDVDNAISNAIGTAIDATSFAWHKVMQFTATTITGIGQAMHYLALETYRALDTLWRYSIPGLITARIEHALTPVTAKLAKTAAAAGSVPAQITNVIRVVKTYPRTVVLEIPALARAVVAPVATAGAVAGALVFPRLNQVERDLQAARRNIAKLGRYATVAGAAGLVAATLGHLGLGAQRCSNVKRLNKGLCGVNPKWIDDLLLGAVSIFGTLSLVKLAEDYQHLIGDVAHEAQHFWRADIVGAGADRKLGQTGL